MLCIIVVMSAIAITAISLSAKSGNTNSLDDIYYGPQKGDFAFSFGIMPAINFIGYMFNGTDSQKYQGVSGLTGSFFSGSTIALIRL